MARVPWTFADYAWPINPYSDKGWVKEPVDVESHPLGSRISTIQDNGDKSARKQVEGWIYGPLGHELMTNLLYWRRNRVTSILTDHTGESVRCRLRTVTFTPVSTASEWREGRQTYQYVAEFIER